MSLALLDWARHHGAWVSESVEIRATPYGGRGMYAACDIEANTELVRLPSTLQLGITQLAEGNDAELQGLARSLPPTELRFLPCAVALCGEVRKGDSSIFCDYIQELPADVSNAIAPCDGFGTDSGDGRYDEARGLAWEPSLARVVSSMRRALRALHESSAPRSLPLRDLCWAASIVCSRSLTRRSVRALTDEELGLVGTYAGRDRTRLLPVIDLVNHAIPESDANADVRHVNLLQQRRTMFAQRNYDRLSTSLIATREIRAGDEVLLDYGTGIEEYQGRLPDQKALLDFGFVLPLHPAYMATLRLEPLLPPPTVATDEAKYLRLAVSNIRKSLEPGPLRFSIKGEPSLATLALALACSFRGPGELARLVQAGESAPETLLDEELLERLVECSTEGQVEHALGVLAAAAETALAKIQSPPNAGFTDAEAAVPRPPGEPQLFETAGASFDVAAQAYREVVCEMLRCVVDHCGTPTRGGA